MHKRVRTLLRVSSKQQLRDGDIPIQRAELQQYMSLHPDWVFDKEYMEKAVSGYKNRVEDRAVLREILADAGERRFDILLTYMSDRIGRQEEYSFYVAALNRSGIEVWTIRDGQLKTQEHVDKLLNYIRFWQNEGESKKTGMRVRDTQRELVKAGKFIGGRAPYGYRLVPSGEISNHGRLLKKPEIAEPEAGTVKKIYELAVNRGMGYERIAGELNRLGIPAAMGGEWKAGTVRSILTNPIYMGYPAIGRRRHQPENRVCAEKAVRELEIISPGVWEQARRIREERQKQFRTAGKKSTVEGTGTEGREEQWAAPFSTKGKLMLTGLAYCGYCRARLRNGSYSNCWVTGTGEKRTSFTGRYQCPAGCRPRSCYAQKYLEETVLEVAAGYLGKMPPGDLTGELRERQRRQMAVLRKERLSVQREQESIRRDLAALEARIPMAIRGEGSFDEERLAGLIREKEQALMLLEDKEEEIQKKQAAFEKQAAAEEETAAEEEAAAEEQRRNRRNAPVDWREVFLRAAPDAKKMLIAALLERVEARDGEIRLFFRFGSGLLLPETGNGEVP